MGSLSLEDSFCGDPSLSSPWGALGARAGDVSFGDASSFSTLWETAEAWTGGVEEAGTVGSLPLEDSFCDDPSLSSPWGALGARAGDVSDVGPPVASLPMEDSFCNDPSFSESWGAAGAWAVEVETLVCVALDVAFSSVLTRNSKNDS
jgi:hypothetical protein